MRKTLEAIEVSAPVQVRPANGGYGIFANLVTTFGIALHNPLRLPGLGGSIGGEGCVRQLGGGMASICPDDAIPRLRMQRLIGFLATLGKHRLFGCRELRPAKVFVALRDLPFKISEFDDVRGNINKAKALREQRERGVVRSATDERGNLLWALRERRV